jgi:hypothetical protein
MAEGWDDETLLAALRQALRARQAVAPEFVEAGKNAFAWHNIDAELAQLTFDSTRDAAHAPGMRAEAASIRALTFTSARLTIELEVTQDSLLGQIVPGQAGTVMVRSRALRSHHECRMPGCRSQWLRREIPSDPAILSASTARSPSPRRSLACRRSLRELVEESCAAARSGSAPCSSTRCA